MGRSSSTSPPRPGADAVKFQTYSARDALLEEDAPLLVPRGRQRAGHVGPDQGDRAAARVAGRAAGVRARARHPVLLDARSTTEAVDELARARRARVQDRLVRDRGPAADPLRGEQGPPADPLHRPRHLRGRSQDAVDACARRGQSRGRAAPVRVALPGAAGAHEPARDGDDARAPSACPSASPTTRLGIHVAVAAAALGASLVEKHFTLDRALPGPGPSVRDRARRARRTWSRQIRDVEAALGDGRQARPLAGGDGDAPEGPAEPGRRARHPARHAPSSATMIAIKRPGFGIRPKLIDLVVGRVAEGRHRRGRLLTWDML